MSESRSVNGVTARLPWLLVGFGGALLAVVVGEWVVVWMRDGQTIGEQHVVGVLTSVPFVVGVALGGYWLARSDLGPDRYGRIGAWFVGGALLFTGINVTVMTVYPPRSALLLSGWLRWASSIGGAVGLLTGIVEARAIERERAAERAAVRAELAESERDLFDYVNSLLRHEALNAANVISGNAELLMADADPDTETSDRLRVIERQSEDLSRIIEDVRVLLQGAGESAPLDAWSLDEVLSAEAAALRERTGAAVTVTGASDVQVVADDLLARLFSNLLANAVEHNDSPDPRVRVSVETTADAALVHVSDNGSGIDEDRLDTLFERDPDENSSHHLGLFLVQSLADRYGGDVWVAETGPEGTTMTVELRRADADGHVRVPGDGE